MARFNGDKDIILLRGREMFMKGSDRYLGRVVIETYRT